MHQWQLMLPKGMCITSETAQNAFDDLVKRNGFKSKAGDHSPTLLIKNGKIWNAVTSIQSYDEYLSYRNVQSTIHEFIVQTITKD